ncbi:hypothetical protein BTJ40_16820 [Microbulbifer sp. A4B17]|uniref:methyltransferase family protein n=1 Tax=Microbulbifer sp. A4B17 TaxID=359370 RepID=UPI000D52F105|nr:isoprenylcysteine carboxylmethyltransferase family protein [Microbulbifer sp. A4B17]AWF82356.1 hypothetical protein BTJ40_16820 [Microbulbifer sp. A4B17]
MYNVNGLFLGVASLALLLVVLLGGLILGAPNYSVAIILLASLASFMLSIWKEGLGSQKEIPRDIQRIKQKLFGLLVYFLLFVLLVKFLSIVSVPHEKFFLGYLPYIFSIFLFFVLYFIYCDKFEALKDDEWSAFRYFFADGGKAGLFPVLRGIVLKALFLPLMFLWLDVSIWKFMDGGISRLLSPETFIVEFIKIGTIFDLYIGFLGYLLVSRLNGSGMHVDDGWRSWIFCLACYPPFYNIVQLLLKPSDDVYWGDFFTSGSAQFYIWGGMLGALWVIYWWSTLSFGLRFSNLSYRGLVDQGPYKYVKHPAYLSKVCYWWLLTVPFVSPLGSWGVIQNVICLSGISWIYFMRAREEERFLSRFPEYRSYQKRIQREGLRARINKLQVL